MGTRGSNKTWEILLHQLGADHIDKVIVHYVAFIFSNTAIYTTSMKQNITEFLTSILSNNNTLSVETYQLLRGFRLPKDMEYSALHALEPWCQSIEPVQLAQSQLQLMRHKSFIVVQLALHEFECTLAQHTNLMITGSDESAVLDASLTSQAISTCFDLLFNYDSNNRRIQHACVRCLGAIGAIDPSRVAVCSPRKLLPLTALIQPPQICLDFAWSLIKDKLLQEFFAAPDATSQGHMAYTLQCMLAYCGMRTVATATASFFSTEWINAYWRRLSADECRTLEPFRSSRYSVKLQLPDEFPQPIYAHQSSFRGWLSMWSQSLRKSLRTPHIRKLFSACKSAIASEECTVAQHILPHLVLNALLDGSVNTRERIIDEILAVLNDVKDWESSSQKRHLCVEMVASIVEQLFGWIKTQKRQAILRTSTSGSISNSLPSLASLSPSTALSAVATVPTHYITQLERLLAAIPRDLLAEAAFNCKAYARAFLHYEHYVREQRSLLTDEEMRPLYHRLQHMYTFADEPDIVDGISTKFPQKSIEQQVFEHETAGRWTAAQTCYELVIQRNPSSLATHLGYINTLRQLGRLESLRMHVAGLKQLEEQMLLNQPTAKPLIEHASKAVSKHWEPALNTELLTASWSLHNWNELDQLIDKSSYEPSFESDLALILQSIKHRDATLLEQRLMATRERLLPSLTAACAESYRRAYDQTLKLHMLHDIETFAIGKLGMSLSYVDRTAAVSLAEWPQRLQSTMATFKAREPILRLQRALLSIAQSEPREMGESWLTTASLARRTGIGEMAHVASLQAEQLNVPWAGLQLAKLHWENGQRSSAIQLLDALRQTQPTNASPWTETQKAKMNLLRVRWMEETGSSKSNVLIIKYTEIVKEHQDFEDGYFYFARYFNKLSDNQANISRGETAEQHSDAARLLQQQQREEKRVEYARHACKLYAQTLVAGSKYIHQAMPKLLTLWLDLGAQILPEREHVMRRLIDGKDKLGEHMKELNNSIIRRMDKIAPHQFLMAFSQMVSRICHPNTTVFPILERLIIQVLASYPQQALWSLMSVARSTYIKRSNRCAAILEKVKSMDTSGSLSRLILNFTTLVDELLVMANYKVRRGTRLSMKKQFSKLLQLAPLPVIVPLQRSLSVSIMPSFCSDARPFPNDLPTIQGFDDEIETMASMQAPRKMTIIGSDGRRYLFLCKPKDDLRKDARLMEFYSMINQFLGKNAESRKRRLCIRTYAVVPLNETCGLIEWVNHTTGYRHILLKVYRSKGIPVLSGAEVKDMMNVNKSSLERVFIKQVLPRFPRVFHEWFLEMYPDPMQWFIHRLNYANTAAVMSMVGYMVGLGDRHGENILLDESNGDCVHVDFNCLFEKGKKLAIPEMVPFRLTHNMVDALGVTGYEGVFRRSCEVTTHVLRGHTESLMSTLEAFAHDPLVEWNKTPNQANNTTGNAHGGETVNAKAAESLEKIHNKLKGVQDSGLPLSVEGYVNELIREATNTKSLAEMYVGWAPYL